MSQARTTRLYSDILLSVVLILLLATCYAITAGVLWKMASDACYHEIEEAADKAAATLRQDLRIRQENLYLIAATLSLDASSSPERLRKMMEMFCIHQHIDALCVQLPDGTVISGGSRLPNYAVLPSFEAMRDRLPYISGRFPGIKGARDLFFYQAVPILHEGKLQGILYGFMNLKLFPSFFEADLPYGGKSQLYLLDGDTGDFLMDMWHDSLGNLFDGSMGTREAKPGYSSETLMRDLADGRAGYFVFISRTAGEYFYTRYQPVGINNWSIQLTVLESVAFSMVRKINRILVILGVMVTAITVVYFFMAFRQYRRQLRRNQDQIRRTSFMFDVQQILFDAHQSSELMTRALQHVANTVDAEGMLLITLQHNYVQHITSWYGENAGFQKVLEGEHLDDEFPQAYRSLVRNQGLLFYDDERNRGFSDAELDKLRDRNIHSLMLVPVLDREQRLLGVLCAVNLRKRWKDCSYLECVACSFMMAMRNTESYRIIREMGTMDTLTGMKNRNSYEAALPRYDAMACEALHCIYIDVNGLHELNNEQGHEAGDAMLRYVAEAVRNAFGGEHSYRIGGDEFVAFFTGGEDAVSGKVAELCRKVEARGYHISVGSACRKGNSPGIDQLIARAEAVMYQEKRAFYATREGRGERRR
ncbi:MAG: diguanylate cyclase [Desulfovibrio sp.]|uniref:sensor domain-containing diguanylate cyclase n=1 Tax=Desulfovibrio sp. TaxID=885 RepID=UPI0025C25705|nr:diguanylate cyclase [Desulfovibrio sp.]MCI7568148.1 diguanylate cyclase [Desulfovibrio sp.]